MPFSLTIKEVTDAVSGNRVCGPEDAVVTGLTWDSRQVEPGMLFCGFPGERVDGNDFVASAVKRGAACCLMTREPREEERASAEAAGCALVAVDEGPASIERLAERWRRLIDPVCVGVTGSTGKTTTKDLLACVLQFMGPVAATKANQNNELGVPATVLAAGRADKALVVEVGMRGRHQIDRLCQRFVRPSIGVVTNVGTSHLELLGSRENIARAKSELIESLPDDGLAVLPAEDDFVGLMRATAAKGRPAPVRILTFGRSEQADVRATEIEVDAAGIASFTLNLPDGSSVPVKLAIPGTHNVLNACAAAAVAHCLGATGEQIAALLSQARSGASRLEVLAAPGGFTVIDDAYNANPDSMRAALKVLASLDVSGRRIAVLGDMGELGPTSPELHRQVGREAAASGVDLLVCVGELAAGIAQGAVENGLGQDAVVRCADAKGALAALEGKLFPGDAVLVKASHSMGLEHVAKGLVNRQ